MASLDPHHVRRLSLAGGVQKQVMWVHHGQSLADAERADADQDSTNPRWVDAPLTPLGRQQARSWAGIAPTWKVQRVYCSPLMRTLESACQIFSHCDVELHITPHAREGWWFSTENRGRLRAALEEGIEAAGADGAQHWTPIGQLPGAHKLRGLEQLEAPIPDVWDPQGEAKRAGAEAEDDLFAKWRRGLEQLKLELLRSSASRIAVVCHWGTIEALTGVDCAKGSIVPTLVNSQPNGEGWQCTVCGPILDHPPLGIPAYEQVDHLSTPASSIPTSPLGPAPPGPFR